MISVGCLAAYSWLGWVITTNPGLEQGHLRLCYIRNVTGIPCPSCGSTRSVLHLAQGHFQEALQNNPLGFVLFLLLILLPTGLFYDLIRQKEVTWQLWNKLEKQLKQPLIAIPLGSLLVINWIWNIVKDI